MRRIVLALVGLTLLALPLSTLPTVSRTAGAAPARDRITAIRVVIGKSTKAFDTGQGESGPAGMFTPSFDDSLWGHLTPVPDEVLSCVSQKMGGWDGFPVYWGSKLGDYYVLRQHFSLPKADSYGGSVVDIRAYSSGPYVMLNGQNSAFKDYNGQLETVDQLQIGTALVSGDNVLAVGIHPQTGTTTSSGLPCNAISFIITIRAHNAIGVLPTPTRPTPSQPAAKAGVTAVYPTAGTSLPRSAPVAFVWKPFPKAANYVLQIWLSKRAGGSPLPTGANVTFSTLVSGRTSYSWDAGAFLPGTYQYDLVPLDSSGNALAPPSSLASFVLTQ